MSHNSYEQELREQECVRRGDFEGLAQAIRELDMDRVGVLSRDTLRNRKNLSIVVVTLSSRSAIEGGLSPETAFTMSDTFIQRLEDEHGMDRLMALVRKAELEFCLAVRNNSHSATTNPVVLRCRDLVARRVNAKLTVAELADALNISPDYLSQLFSREEGITLSDYISRERCSAAARELIFTDKSFDDIAAAFSYSSQSHFGKVFKKWTGMTPKQYRTHYGSIIKE